MRWCAWCLRAHRDDPFGARMVRLARFRLRFLLQEIDLPPGESILGRSASCHITIEDPLVSRRHARIQVTGDRATIEDLGSRNGLFVGGQLARGVVDVSAGARVRVGTQELVICRSAEEVPARGPAPVTGFMIHCGGCGFPYAAEHACCPHCGSSARNEDTTLSGSSKQAWSLDLVVDTLLRAKDLGRWSDLERVLRQARRVVEELLASSEPVDRGRLDELADAAVALSMEQGRAEWGRWILEVYATLGWLPPGEIGRSLGDFVETNFLEGEVVRGKLEQTAVRIRDFVVPRLDRWKPDNRTGSDLARKLPELPGHAVRTAADQFPPDAIGCAAPLAAWPGKPRAPLRRICLWD